MTYWFTVANTGQAGKETIPTILHMLEDHAADFIERSSPGSGDGVYGEHGAESIKNSVTAKKTLLNTTSHDTFTEYAKKEHYRLVHPDAKALMKPVILKRK